MTQSKHIRSGSNNAAVIGCSSALCPCRQVVLSSRYGTSAICFPVYLQVHSDLCYRDQVKKAQRWTLIQFCILLKKSQSIKRDPTQSTVPRSEDNHSFLNLTSLDSFELLVMVVVDKDSLSLTMTTIRPTTIN